LNGDRIVDEKDVDIVLRHMGNVTFPPFPNYDFNQDGIVDMLDLQFITGKIPPSFSRTGVEFLEFFNLKKNRVHFFL
jgi:hypothetical protein